MIVKNSKAIPSFLLTTFNPYNIRFEPLLLEMKDFRCGRRRVEIVEMLLPLRAVRPVKICTKKKKIETIEMKETKQLLSP